MDLALCSKFYPAKFLEEKLSGWSIAPIELVGIECALGRDVTEVLFYEHYALINPPYWISLYC